MSRKKREVSHEDVRYDRHHVRPRSRGGGSRDNIVVLPRRWHSMWHAMFVNMTVEEVHEYLGAIMVPGTDWTYKSLYALRLSIMGREK